MSSTPEKQVFGTFKNTFELFKAAESLNLQSFEGNFLSCKMKANISIVNKDEPNIVLTIADHI